MKMRFSEKNNEERTNTIKVISKRQLLEKICTTTQRKLTQDITCYNVC